MALLSRVAARVNDQERTSRDRKSRECSAVVLTPRVSLAEKELDNAQLPHTFDGSNGKIDLHYSNALEPLFHWQSAVAFAN